VQVGRRADAVLEAMKMRVAWSISSAFLSLMLLAGPSSAQSKGPKPWCIADGAFGSGTLDCTYWTFKQCIDTQRGAGGTCVENPRLLWERRDRAMRRQGRQ
jgi:hypothetical protein